MRSNLSIIVTPASNIGTSRTKKVSANFSRVAFTSPASLSESLYRIQSGFLRLVGSTIAFTRESHLMQCQKAGRIFGHLSNGIRNTRSKERFHIVRVRGCPATAFFFRSAIPSSFEPGPANTLPARGCAPIGKEREIRRESIA